MQPAAHARTGEHRRAHPVLPNGRLLVMGEVSAVDSADFSFVRLFANGTLDPGFDLDGRRQIDFGSIERPMGLTLQADGKMLALGAQLNDEGTEACAMLARLHPDGSLDTSFAGGGWTCLTPGGGVRTIAFGNDVAVQANGRIVLALAANTATTPPTSTWHWRSYSARPCSAMASSRCETDHRHGEHRRHQDSGRATSREIHRMKYSSASSPTTTKPSRS